MIGNKDGGGSKNRNRKKNNNKNKSNSSKQEKVERIGCSAKLTAML